MNGDDVVSCVLEGNFHKRKLKNIYIVGGRVEGHNLLREAPQSLNLIARLCHGDDYQIEGGFRMSVLFLWYGT